MDAAIAQLRVCVGELLAYYPQVLRNVFTAEAEATGSPTASTGPPPPPQLQQGYQGQVHDASVLTDTIEGFLTELTRVLSVGLCDGDLGLWSVLELLECIPGRMQAVAEATAAEPATSSTSPASSASGGEVLLQHVSRFRFAAQLVYVVRSTFPAASQAQRARILLRLTLNQGCLLAALELLRLWCWSELQVFYKTGTHTTSAAATATALLVQPSRDSDTWNSFVAAVAPVAGPPVAEIAAGAPKVAAQPFHLQLLVPGLDDNAAASRAYYAAVQSYARGTQLLRPSALACYRAARQQQQQQRANASSASGRPAPSAAAAAAAAAAPLGAHRGADARPPAEQLVLRVESLPVDAHVVPTRRHAPSTAATTTTTAAVSTAGSGTLQAARRGRRSQSSGGSSAVRSLSESSRAVTQTSSSSLPSQQRRHHHRGERKKRRRRRPSPPRDAPLAIATPEGAGGGDKAGARDTGGAAVPAAAAPAEGPPPAAAELSAADVSEPHLDVPARVAAPALPAPPPTELCTAVGSAVPAGDGTTTGAASAREWADLRQRLWLCWTAALAHAESEERSRLAAHDMDAAYSAAH